MVNNCIISDKIEDYAQGAKDHLNELLADGLYFGEDKTTGDIGIFIFAG